MRADRFRASGVIAVLCISALAGAVTAGCARGGSEVENVRTPDTPPLYEVDQPSSISSIDD